MKLLVLPFAALLGLGLSTSQAGAATIINDFSAGVSAADDPDGSFGKWFDATHNTFGTPSADTLAGSPAMKITDGGFTNGVYSIYSAVVPATGLYTVSANMLVNDTATSEMTAYQMGVIVNGVDRGPDPSKIADATIVANYGGPLTLGTLDATTTETVTTSQFSASAGDNLLIAFSTDVTGGYDSNAGFWNGATVLVDNIMLNPIPEPTSLILVSCGLFGLAFAARRRAC